MRYLLTILLLWTGIVYAQYPYQYDFDVDEDGWTITDPGSDYGWEAPGYLCFNRTGNYVDAGLHQWTSPVEDHTSTDSIRVTFRILHSVRIGGAMDRVNFCWNDGGWNCQLIGNGSWFIDLPNTTTQFRIELNAIGNGSLNGKYVHLDYLHIEQWNGGVLPIDLIAWDAYAEGNNIVLKWITASEINNDRFEILHSTNGYNWEIIHTQKGAGNSNTTKTYYTKHHTDSSENYYKLRQVDFDGKSEEFKIVYLYIKEEELDVKSYIYFNPLGQAGGIQLKKETK